MNSASRAMVWLVLLAEMLALPALAAAGTPAYPVLVLVPSADPDQHDEVLQAIEARLRPQPVVVRRIELAEPIDEGLGLRVATEQHALTVVWLSERDSQIHLLTPALSPQPRVRRLAGDAGEQVALPEAVASMVYGEIELVLAQEALPSPPSRPSSEPTPIPEPQADRDHEPGEESAPGAAAWSVGAGVVVLPNRTRGPVEHGIHGTIGARLRPGLGLRVGGDLLRPVPLDSIEGEVRRGLLRLSLGRPLGLGAIEVSPTIGGVLEILRIEGLSHAAADPTATGPHLAGGITAELITRAHLRPWLEPSLLVGADASLVEHTAVVDGDAVYRRPHLTLHVTLGMAVSLGSR
jgi:hypothetical protein